MPRAARLAGLVRGLYIALVNAPVPPPVLPAAAAQLEGILRRAEARLHGAGDPSDAEFVGLYRRFWTWEEQRLRRFHAADSGGVDVARRRAQLMDVVVRHVSDLAWRRSVGMAGAAAAAHALVALGGYGRGEISPCSDIDILILHRGTDDREPAEAFARAALYLMWDIGLTIGHACRSLDECLAVAQADHRTATAMIESRCVWGDAELYEELRGRFATALRTDWREGFVRARLKEERDRKRRFGSTVFLQEPNLKSGPGGLRDALAVWWLAYAEKGARAPADMVDLGLISAAAFGRLQRGYDVLLRVRDALHIASGRRNDVLSLRLQARVAEALGYQGVDEQ